MRIIPVFLVPDGDYCENCNSLDYGDVNKIVNHYHCKLFQCPIHMDKGQMVKCKGCKESREVE